MAAVLIFLVFAGCGGKEDEPEETVVLLEEESDEAKRLREKLQVEQRLD